MTIAAIECAYCGTTSHVPITSTLVDASGHAAGQTAGEHAATHHEDQSTAAGTVSWICRTCVDVVSQPVSWPVLRQLVSAGAQLFDEGEYELPEHPEAPVGGPALTRDDMLDLHTLLEGPHWFELLAAGFGASSVARQS